MSWRRERVPAELGIDRWSPVVSLRSGGEWTAVGGDELRGLRGERGLARRPFGVVRRRLRSADQLAGSRSICLLRAFVLRVGGVYGR